MTHTQHKKSMLSQGVYIFVYLAVLTALEFFVALTFESVVILVVVALVKAVLVVYYYMHVYQLNAENEGDEDSYEYKTGTNRLGLWLFLISDSFVFGGLLVMRMNLLGLTRPQLNQPLGLITISGSMDTGSERVRSATTRTATEPCILRSRRCCLLHDDRYACLPRADRFDLPCHRLDQRTQRLVRREALPR